MWVLHGEKLHDSCVSERTLRRLCQEMGWPMREQEFSQISDHALDTVVRNILSLSPNSESIQ